MKWLAIMDGIRINHFTLKTFRHARSEQRRHDDDGIRHVAGPFRRGIQTHPFGPTLIPGPARPSPPGYVSFSKETKLSRDFFVTVWGVRCKSAAEAAITTELPPESEPPHDIVTIARGCLPLPPHNLSERVPAFPGPADDGKVRTAVVRRRTGGMDNLHAVFPGDFGRRIRLCALAGHAPRNAKAGLDTPRTAGDFPAVSAARAARDSSETFRKRRSFRSNSFRARVFRRRPIFRVVRNRPVITALVPCQPSRPVALAFILAVEPRLVPGSADVPVPDRTVLTDANPDVDLDRTLRDIRGPLRLDRSNGLGSPWRGGSEIRS